MRSKVKSLLLAMVLCLTPSCGSEKREVPNYDVITNNTRVAYSMDSVGANRFYRAELEHGSNDYRPN